MTDDYGNQTSPPFVNSDVEAIERAIEILMSLDDGEASSGREYRETIRDLSDLMGRLSDFVGSYQSNE